MTTEATTTAATTAATTTAATTTAATTTAATTTAAQPAWHGYTEPADVQYVENKGWKAPQDAVKSYREVEKLVGRDPNTLLVLPRADDPAGLRAALGKLGLPEKPDAYELDLPKGVDVKTDPFAQWSKKAFHEVGLLPGQAKQLSGAYNKFLGELTAKADADYQTRVTADKQALLKEWGAGHERMMNVAKAAANALGFTGDVFDAIESQVGYAATMKLFAGIGQKMSEDSFPTGEGKKNFDGALQTPAEAKAAWEQSKLDPNFMKALADKSHPGHAEAQRKQTAWFNIMFPQGA